jgi:hypothetical protein
MNILGNAFTFFVMAASSSLVAFTQVMLKGGKLRFKWAPNSLEISVDLDGDGASN